MLYGHLIAYKEFVYSGDLFYENGSLLPFSIGCAAARITNAHQQHTFSTD